jgi:DNA polymerase III subunit delta
MEAFTFLDAVAKAKPRPVYVLAGDEAFLKRLVRAALDKLLIDEADPAFAVSVIPGERAEWPAIRSELDTLPFLSPRRVVVVESADPFVTKYRPALEKYVAEPSKVGTLVLDVKTWPSNTKLAKLVPDAATIGCRTPSQEKLTIWCRNWAKSAYGKSLDADAAGWLVELAGPEMGVLDQELAKLAVYVGDAKSVTRDDVDRLVGRGRNAETFAIFEKIAAGRPADALALLGRLIDQGEDPLAILGAFSWQLRQLGQVNSSLRSGLSPTAAMDRAEVKPFTRGRVDALLRHLGRRRLDMVYDWLLEADLGMKGSSQLPSQVVLERLVLKLARPRAVPSA